MHIPQIYLDEPCPIDGYGSLTVRVLANMSDADWRRWARATLGDPFCEACAALNETDEAPRQYCPVCTAARERWGASIVQFYGPWLLDHDVSTPAAALALFDDDAALPSELVQWLVLLPDAVRTRRLEAIRKNVHSSSGLTAP